MQEDIIVAGFGGQGVIFAGQLLAYAAMDSDLHVTCVPSYGPEMRGGTANSSVVISDEEIGSPIVTRPTICIVMNGPSLEKYWPLVRPGGLLVVNTSLAGQPRPREGIRILRLKAQDEAAKLGNPRLANVVLLGALLAVRPVVPIDAALAALPNLLSDNRRHLLDVNREALLTGARLAEAEGPPEGCQERP